MNNIKNISKEKKTFSVTHFHIINFNIVMAMIMNVNWMVEVFFLSQWSIYGLHIHGYTSIIFAHKIVNTHQLTMSDQSNTKLMNYRQKKLISSYIKSSHIYSDGIHTFLISWILRKKQNQRNKIDFSHCYES